MQYYIVHSIFATILLSLEKCIYPSSFKIHQTFYFIPYKTHFCDFILNYSKNTTAPNALSYPSFLHRLIRVNPVDFLIAFSLNIRASCRNETEYIEYFTSKKFYIIVVLCDLRITICEIICYESFANLS